MTTPESVGEEKAKVKRGNHVYPLAGTIFEKSSTSLKTWFYAMYLMGSTRCGISAKQVQRETGVTYKTAWRMFNQIRTLLSEGDMQLEGPTVEVDEMYHGGVRKYGTGRPMRGDKKKTPVVGIVQRRGLAIARVVKDVRGSTLLGQIRKHVVPGSTIYTDQLRGYDGIGTMRTSDHKPAKYRQSDKKRSRVSFDNDCQRKRWMQQPAVHRFGNASAGGPPVWLHRDKA